VLEPGERTVEEQPRPLGEHQVVQEIRAVPAERTPDSCARPEPDLPEPDLPEPAAAEQPGPQVTISIGYVEVRAPAPAAPTPKQPHWPQPRLSLDEYLRHGDRR